MSAALRKSLSIAATVAALALLAAPAGAVDCGAGRRSQDCLSDQPAYPSLRRGLAVPSRGGVPFDDATARALDSGDGAGGSSEQGKPSGFRLTSPDRL